jgi:hypothetical protein
MLLHGIANLPPHEMSREIRPAWLVAAGRLALGTALRLLVMAPPCRVAAMAEIRSDYQERSTTGFPVI